MTLYTVHAPRLAPEAAADPAAFVFVKEGFCWPALLLPEIWMIVRRLWLVLLLYLLAMGALVAGAVWLGMDAPWMLVVLARFWFALEANGLRRWTLERNGHALVGVVEGGDLDEAELRFFSGWPEAASVPALAASPSAPLPSPSQAPPAPLPKAPQWAPTPENGGVVGLFPAPGGSR